MGEYGYLNLAIDNYFKKCIIKKNTQSVYLGSKNQEVGGQNGKI